MAADNSALTPLSQGNLDRFDEVYRKYHKPIYANILKIVQHPTEAEDVFQEVFMIFWKNLDKAGQETSLAAWLFVVSRNTALAHLKKKLKASLVLVDNYDLFENIPQEVLTEDATQEQFSIIKKAVDTLPDKRKEIFVLHRFEGKSVEEIAEQLDLNTSTVKEYLKQSVRSIREYILHQKDAAGMATTSLLLLFLR